MRLVCVLCRHSSAVPATTPTPRRLRSDALGAIAQEQFGAFTWSQARASGYPAATISLWVRDGTFRKIQPTVYTRQLGTPSLDTRRAAALLALGSQSTLVQRAALDVYECSRFRRRTVHVGTARRTARTLDGADVVRCQASAHGHVIVHAGHRVTSFAWTVSDLGTDLAAEQIAHVIQQGRMRRRFELHELDAVLALRGRFPGRASVCAALAMYRAGSAGTRSGYEDTVYGWVKEIVRRAPLPNVHVTAGDQEFEVDIPFTGRRLCIEVDGPQHDDPAQQERDRVRDAALRAAGFRVVRFHWRDIRDRPEWCRRRLRELVA